MSDDLADALEHANMLLESPLEIERFTVERGVIPVADLQQYDDLGAWTQWRYGELRDLDRAELVAELNGFRGSAWARRALTWNQTNVPPIVIVETDYGTVIGDGRGRVSLAIGLGWQRLPAIKLTEKR